MAQNTALQELIERFEKRKKESKAFNELLFFDAVISEATELLPKERNQIEEAHDKGMVRYCQWEPDRHGNEAPTGSDYFTNTFTQK